ncbi:hypothetical protein L7F22_033120 [Adiantum nelumboides]|nr:hypothetical protein [Adiantum nelumboides]
MRSMIVSLCFEHPTKAAVADGHHSFPLHQDEALDVIGSGTFGLIRKRSTSSARCTTPTLSATRSGASTTRTASSTSSWSIARAVISDPQLSGAKRPNTQLDEDVVWSYLAQMVLALHECHYRGSNTSRDSAILHRDLKPENVFLDGQKNIIRSATLACPRRWPPRFARTYVGTPYYMSPELATGAPYDAKSDIWALGCVAYELCALAPPFDANDQQELTRKIKLGNVPRLPKAYSGQLGDVIRSMLELNPKHRPTTRDLLQHGKIANALQALELLAWSGRMAEEREKLRMQWEELDEGRRILAEREAAVCHGELEWRRRKSELEDRERRVEEREQKMTTWEQETASAAALPNHHRGAPASTHQEPASTRPALRPGNRRVSSGGIPRLRSSPAISSEAGNGASHVVEVVHVRSHGTPRSTRDRSRYGVRPLLGGGSRQREESNGGDEWVEDGEFGSGSGSASSTGSTSDDANVEVSNVAVAENSREDSPSTSISSSSVKASSRPAASSATSTMARRQNSQSSSHDSEATSVRPSARRSARVSQVSPAMRAWIQQTQASSSEDQDMTMRDASQMMEDKENHNVASAPALESKSSPIPVSRLSSAAAAASRPALMTRATAPATSADALQAPAASIDASASVPAQVPPPPAVYDLDDEDLPSPFLKKVTREIPRAMEKHLANLAKNGHAAAAATAAVSALCWPRRCKKRQRGKERRARAAPAPVKVRRRICSRERPWRVRPGRTSPEERVEAADAARDAQVNGSVAKVDDEATLDRRVDLLGDLDTLALDAYCEPLMADSRRDAVDLSRGAALVTVTSISPRSVSTWESVLASREAAATKALVAYLPVCANKQSVRGDSVSPQDKGRKGKMEDGQRTSQAVEHKRGLDGSRLRSVATGGLSGMISNVSHLRPASQSVAHNKASYAPGAPEERSERRP